MEQPRYCAMNLKRTQKSILALAVGLAVAAAVAIASGAVYDRLGALVLFAGWAVVMVLSVAIAWWLGREHMSIPVSVAGTEAG